MTKLRLGLVGKRATLIRLADYPMYCICYIYSCNSLNTSFCLLTVTGFRLLAPVHYIAAVDSKYLFESLPSVLKTVYLEVEMLAHIVICISF